MAAMDLGWRLTKSLSQLQKEDVVMELECIDRMCLNAYVPQLTSEAGIAAFCRESGFASRCRLRKECPAMSDHERIPIGGYDGSWEGTTPMTPGHPSGREALIAPTGIRLMAATVATLMALLNSPLPAAQTAQSNTTSPVFELQKGERYFRIDGAPAFVLGRNPVGVSPEAFAAHFEKAATAGERFVRIHLLIGECGLDWAPPRGTLDVAPGAEVGIRHAIWASVVSGGMSGRMLWWQDGWDQFPLPTFQGSIALRLTATLQEALAGPPRGP